MHRSKFGLTLAESSLKRWKAQKLYLVLLLLKSLILAVATPKNSNGLLNESDADERSILSMETPADPERPVC